MSYHYSISDFVGNVGMVILLGTFALSQTKKIDLESLGYNIGNLISAVLLLINLYYKPNLSSIIIEIWWIIFSVYGLIRVIRDKFRRKGLNSISLFKKDLNLIV